MTPPCLLFFLSIGTRGMLLLVFVIFFKREKYFFATAAYVFFLFCVCFDPKMISIALDLLKRFCAILIGYLFCNICHFNSTRYFGVIIESTLAHWLRNHFIV